MVSTFLSALDTRGSHIRGNVCRTAVVKREPQVGRAKPRLISAELRSFDFDEDRAVTLGDSL
jgi:hypothetical protein